jgi:hypothetical protein
VVDFGLRGIDPCCVCCVLCVDIQKRRGGWLLWRGRGKEERPGHTPHTGEPPHCHCSHTSTHILSTSPSRLHTYLGLGLLVEVGSQGGAGDATAGHAHALSLVETAGGERLQGAPAPAQRHGSAGLLVVACEVEGCGVCVKEGRVGGVW